MANVPPHHLIHVATFRKVAEVKNFTVAARELRITPSAASRQITRLEESLGVQLFARTTRSLRLTEAGETFYNHCVRGLTELDHAIAMVSQYCHEPSGQLRISTTPCFGKLHVVPVVVDFLKAYPKISVDITLSHSESSFLENDVDIVVTAATVRGQRIAYEELAPMHHVICATPDYLETHGRPKTPHDLVKHNCIITTQPNRTYEWPFVHGRRRRYVPVSGNFKADSMEALYSAVMAGLGIARLPNYVIGPELRNKDLISLFPGSGKSRGAAVFDATTPNVMKAYHLKGRFPEPKIQAFIEFLKDRFQSNSVWQQRQGVF